MPDRARYYLARVIKLGDLDAVRFEAAITDPVIITRTKYHYTFTDVTLSTTPAFIFGRLVKFEPKGEVGVVDPTSHAELMTEVPNKRVASSPFVYIPEFSGVAFQHVWNALERDHFMRIFPQLVTARYRDFMVNCSLEAISDMRTFVQRLARFTRILKIHAAVHPPNPLFSPVWKALHDYLKKRRVKQLQLHEHADSRKGVDSRIVELARRIIEAPPEEAPAVVDAAVRREEDIGDAAVLMAADGYGRAKVEGQAGTERLVVKTRETQLSFEHERSPDAVSLYRSAYERFTAVTVDRGLRGHEEDR